LSDPADFDQFQRAPTVPEQNAVLPATNQLFSRFFKHLCRYVDIIAVR